MDFIDESVSSADSSKLSEEDSVDQIESVVTRAAKVITDSLGSKEPPSAGQGSMLDKSIISFSSGSQSSTDSYDTVFDPRNNNIRGPEPCLNDQPAHSSTRKKHDQPYSVRSSCDASDITHESGLMSLRQSPPLQVMDRSAPYDPGRISSSVFTANSTPQEWSLASNESLFSLHVGSTGFSNGALAMGDPSPKSSDFGLSDEMMSNRASMVAQQETATGEVDKEGEQAGPPISDNSAHDFIVQKIHDRIDAKAGIPEMSWDPRKNKGRIQPLPPSVNNKPEKPSSYRKKSSCCVCSCAGLFCCCSASAFGCSKQRCGCCQMPSCSCCNCSLGWCCNWTCCSIKSCCSNWNCCSIKSCCSNWSCCPKGSCCPSCSNCSKAICCWNWSCWKIFCCWNWTCCSKESCCKSWSCCSKGSCCGSWSCCSKEACCGSWNCCSKGSCCRSWNCCSKGSCFRSWNCCPSGSCCKSWSCCKTGSCWPKWNCCCKGICSWKCGSCCQSWKCCTTGGCCCSCLSIKMCCFSSSTKPREGRGRLELPHHHKTKTLGRTGICGYLSCSSCSCC